MTIRAHGRQFMADITIKGQRYRPLFDTAQAAEAWELEARAANLKGLPIPGFEAGNQRHEAAGSGGIKTLGALIDHVEKTQWANAKGRKELVGCAWRFAKWAGPDLPPSAVLTSAKVDEYVAHLIGTQRSGATVNRRLSAVSVLAKTAKKLRLIPELPEIEQQREGQGRIRFFTREEEDAVLNLLRHWGQDQWAHLFGFLVDTGARLGEAEKVTWADLQNGRLVTFWDTKSGRSRTIPMTVRARAAVEAARALQPLSKGPFAGLSRPALRGIWDRLRATLPFMGEETVIHTWRHTCASRLVQAGWDIRRVKEWMGHESINTTMRYAHLAPADLEAMVGALEPKLRVVAA